MRWLGTFTATIFVASVFAMPVRADFAQDTRECEGYGQDFEARVAACTRQIASGHWRGHNLSTRYNNRGNARLDSKRTMAIAAENPEVESIASAAR
jgi:hypothetical protein